MVPPRFVPEKKKTMKSGRQMKANGLVGVYDVLIKYGQPVREHLAKPRECNI